MSEIQPMYKIEPWMWGRFVYSLPPELIIHVMSFLKRAEVVCLRGHSSTFEEFTINLRLESRPDNFYAPYPKDNGWSLSDWENYRSMELMSTLYVNINAIQVLQPRYFDRPQLYEFIIKESYGLMQSQIHHQLPVRQCIQQQPQSQPQRRVRIVRTYKPPIKNIKLKSIYRYHLR
jgi:hypothetical protein